MDVHKSTNAMIAAKKSTNAMTKPQSICPARTIVSSSSKSKRKHARKDKQVECLPSDVLCPILSRLPASFLYEDCRFACKAWAEMLRCPQFVNSHLSDCTHPSCFLIQTLNLRSETLRIQSVDIKDWNNIQVNDLNLQFPGRIVSSSDGVVLILSHVQNYTVIHHYIANPITRQVLKLPDPTNFRPSLYFSGIARIPETRELKVVVVSEVFNDFFVMTVGDGRPWRRLRSPPGLVIKWVSNHGCSVGGVVYSTILYGQDYDSIFAVDLRNESVHLVKLPEKSDDGKYKTVLCNRGRLYLMDAHPRRNNKFLRVWLLKDLHWRGWVRIQNLDISAFGLVDPFAIPLVWLESEEVLVVLTRTRYLERGEGGSTLPRILAPDKAIMGCCLRSGNRKTLSEVGNLGNQQVKALCHTNSLVRF